MLTEYLSEITSNITPLLETFFSEIGVPISNASALSELLVGLLNVSLLLAVIVVPFLVLSFLLKLIWRYTNVTRYN